jgi:hypothetical protein
MPTKLKVRVPKIGEVWQDTDTRFVRTIQITDLDTVTGRVGFTCLESRRMSRASLSRFHGGSGGYRFLRDGQDAAS